MSSDDTRPEVIGSIADVVAWLREQGYCRPGKDDPVKKSQVYNDSKKNLLCYADGKSITLTEAMAYVARAQLMKTGVNRAVETEDLAVQKMRHEVRKALADAVRKEYENDVFFGKYKRTEDCELDIAMNTAALDAGIRHLIRVNAVDIIKLTEPRQVLDFLYPQIDRLMDEFARMKTVDIVVRRREEEQHASVDT